MSQILLVGPRASGKLTYLSGLAGWKSQQKYNSKVKIKMFGEDTEKLGQLWENLVSQGCTLAPTNLITQYLYQFSLDFSIPRFFKDELQHIHLVIRNVPGEIFEMPSSEGWKFYGSYMSRDQDSILIMIDCSMYRFDEEYAGNINELLKCYLMHNSSMAMCRIALVISQCDAVDVWINRKNTTKVISRFRQVLEVLNHYSAEQKFTWKPFVNSTFGGLGRDYLEANSTSDEYCSTRGRVFRGGKVLKDPSKWKPYGLFSPLYWLCTGKDLNGLDYY